MRPPWPSLALTVYFYAWVWQQPEAVAKPRLDCDCGAISVRRMDSRTGVAPWSHRSRVAVVTAALQAWMSAILRRSSQLQLDFGLTVVRRPFDCLSNVIKVKVT